MGEGGADNAWNVGVSTIRYGLICRGMHKAVVIVLVAGGIDDA